MKNIKWLFSVCLMVVFVCFSNSGVRAEGTEIDTSVLKYEENEDGTITIYKYTGTDETVVFPSEIDGKKVKRIGQAAFHSGYDTFKHVIISEGITELVAAFQSCENLETVSLPSTLKTIGESAFSGCIKLSEINLPDGLVSIGDWAFYECGKLNNVVLPDGLINIGRSAFSNCSSIEKLIVPDSVMQIGKNAFFRGNLVYMIIYGNPDAYIKTYCDADYNIKFSCINHPNIVIDPAVAPNCKEPGRTQGSHCTVCGTYIVKPQRIDPNEQHIWRLSHFHEATISKKGWKSYNCTVCGIGKSETIPKASVHKKGELISDLKNDFRYKVTKPGKKNGTVEFISSQLSKNNISIPYVVRIAGITYKVTSIAKNAFKNNKNLKKITIGGNITKINANALSMCANLKIIKINSINLKFVGKNAFKGISPKAKIKVPSNCLEKYKKLLTKKGQRSSVKITK